MGGFLEYLDSKEQNFNKIEEAKKPQSKPAVKQSEKKKVIVKKVQSVPKKKVIKEDTAVGHAIDILEGINDNDSIINDQDVNQINKSKVAVVEDVTDHASALL